MQPPYRLETISQFHKLRKEPEPLHPLLSILDITGERVFDDGEPKSLIFDFYTIAFKSVYNGKMKYGQQLFDFDSGMMGFSSPGQVIQFRSGTGKTYEAVRVDVTYSSRLPLEYFAREKDKAV